MIKTSSSPFDDFFKSKIASIPNVNDGLIIFDDQKCLWINEEIIRFFGGTKHLFINKSLNAIQGMLKIPITQILLDSREKSIPFPMKQRLEISNKSGNPAIIEFSIYSMDIQPQSQYLFVCHDITEYLDIIKETQIQIKEIHHRIKNNLQTIISILNLQNKYISPENASKILSESKDRILSIAVLHDLLYRSETSEKLSFSRLVEKLVQTLFDTYMISFSKIQVKYSIEPIDIGLKMCLPLSLILNELITNSLKYAFLERDSGQIYIHFKVEHKKYILIIEDNGVGLPPSFDFEKINTFGLFLVKVMIKQLKGKMDINPEHLPGTQIVLTIPVNET